MPRGARGLVGEQVYHVLNRGNGRATVFHKPEDFQAFVNLLREVGQAILQDPKIASPDSTRRYDLS